jgi:hypothetical protein
MSVFSQAQLPIKKDLSPIDADRRETSSEREIRGLPDRSSSPQERLLDLNLLSQFLIMESENNNFSSLFVRFDPSKDSQHRHPMSIIKVLSARPYGQIFSLNISDLFRN